MLKIKIVFLLLILFQGTFGFLSPLDIRDRCWMKKLDYIDEQMVTLLQKRLDLVEKLDKSNNYSYNYRYDREKINKLMKKTKTLDHSLVDSMWRLMGNHARQTHQEQIIKKSK